MYADECKQVDVVEFKPKIPKRFSYWNFILINIYISYLDSTETSLEMLFAITSRSLTILLSTPPILIVIFY